MRIAQVQPTTQSQRAESRDGQEFLSLARLLVLPFLVAIIGLLPLQVRAQNTCFLSFTPGPNTPMVYSMTNFNPPRINPAVANGTVLYYQTMSLYGDRNGPGARVYAREES